MGFLGSIFATVGATALAANLALVLSAIPAVTGKGAPYMPTLRRALDAVFLRALPSLPSLAAQGRPLRVVDLGSGDGRVVIEAARNGHHAVGYEINPLLVAAASAWAAADKRWQPWPPSASAKFRCRDLWTVSLEEADVVFVYGLSPIMDRLSVKLLEEAPNAIVVSNVFEMNPAQWKKVFSEEEAHVYRSIKAAAEESKIEG